MFENGGGVSQDKEVSEDRYYEMLGVVPPLYFSTLDGVSVRGGFAVGEVYTHEIYDGKYRGVYDAFYQKDGKYYQVTGMVYFTDKNSAKRAEYKYAGGGGVKSKKIKGDIGKSGTQYGYTLAEWENMAKKKGLLVSPKQWWKSREGKEYTDNFGRKKKIGQYSDDERQEMQMYGYLIANGLDLGSKIIPLTAKKYVEENNYIKYANGGGVDMDNYAYAKTRGIENTDWEKEMKEYYGANWDKLTKDEKESAIEYEKREAIRSKSFANGGGVGMINLGSKVKIVKNLEDYKGYKKGEILEVIGYDDMGYFDLENNKGKQWYVSGEEIELIEKGTGDVESRIEQELYKTKKIISEISGHGEYFSVKDKNGKVIFKSKSLNQTSDFIVLNNLKDVFVVSTDRNGRELIKMAVKNKYKNGGEVVGKRIKMIYMDDPQPIEKGTMGTIIGVDGMGQYMVKWDNGRNLSVIPDEDEFEIIEKEYKAGGSVKKYGNGGGIGQYHVYGYLRSYDTDAEVKISEDVVAMNEDDAMNQVLKMYEGASPDSDLMVDLVDSYE
jgi:hypothetical protein